MISSSKDKLIEDIEALGVANWSRPVKRRGENKSKQEVDDILCALSFIDESVGLSKLPLYVTDNLEDLPLMRMEKGEYAVLISKLDKIEETVSSVRMNIQSDHRSRYVIPTDQSASSLRGQSVNVSAKSPLIAGPSRLSAPNTSIMPQQLTSDNESTDCNDNDNIDSEGFTTVRKKRKRSPRMPSNPIEGSSVQQTANNNQSAEPSRLWSDRAAYRRDSTTNNEQNKRGKKTFKVIGRSKNIPQTDSTSKRTHVLKSAKPYVRKAVYGVYNVECSETEASIENFIDYECGVKPISCFKINLKDSESIAFRVCIDASVADAFLNPDIWESGIVIGR